MLWHTEVAPSVFHNLFVFESTTSCTVSIRFPIICSSTRESSDRRKSRNPSRSFLSEMRSSAGGQADQSGMQIRDGRLRVCGTPAHLAALSTTFANYKSGHFTWVLLLLLLWHSHSTRPDANDSKKHPPGFRSLGRRLRLIRTYYKSEKVCTF